MTQTTTDPVTSLDRMAARTRRRRRLLIAATSGVLAAGIFALVAALGGDGGDETAAPTDAVAAVYDAGSYPVPGYVPAGAAVHAQIPVPDPAMPPVIATVVGRRISLNGERPAQDIDEIAAVYVRKTIPADAAWKGEIITVGERQVLLHPPGGFAGSARLTWTEGEVTAMVLVPGGDAGLGIAVVEGVSWTGDDPTAPGAVTVEPPGGHEVIVEPALLSVVPGALLTMEWEDAAPDVTGVGAPEVVVDTLQIDIRVSADSPELILANHPIAQRFEMRGRPAYITWQNGFNGVVWEEEPGMSVTVGGVHADPTELIRIAEALDFTDEATWKALYEVFDPGGPPTTPAPQN